MPEDAKRDAQPFKPMTLREAKQLASARLRNPKTSAESVLKLLEFMEKYGGWHRRRKDQPTVDDLVGKLEAQQRKARGAVMQMRFRGRTDETMNESEGDLKQAPEIMGEAVEAKNAG